MNPTERKDLFKMLNALSARLFKIADETEDIETSDQLNELGEVTEESAFQLMSNR